jgi:molecular chaperone GrpE
LYLRAEFENYKRNAIKERSELMKYGGERFIRDLLDIVDNFDRALQVNVNSENLNTFKQGVEMTASELRNLLVKHSVTEIPSEGVAFDPSIHEALSAEATDKVAPGHVARVFKKPYKLHDKVIRTGQVVVAKKPE